MGACKEVPRGQGKVIRDAKQELQFSGCERLQLLRAAEAPGRNEGRSSTDSGLQNAAKGWEIAVAEAVWPKAGLHTLRRITP